MPGMRLDFLKNPSQRVATGKSLPLKQVEAVVLYGRPEQRAKAVQKLLPSVYGLSLNATTHHILLTLLDQCDNLVRVQMLYHVRRKILDLCTSPVGNSVVQHMVDKLPARQKKEIAEALVRNVEEDEFKRLCEHPYGNHVAQKLMDFPDCAEVVTPSFEPYIGTLATHPYAQRVVAKYIHSVENGWERVLQVLFPMLAGVADNELSTEDDDALDVAVCRLFEAQEESMVVTELLHHLLVPAELKDAICAHLCEYAEEYLFPTATTPRERMLGVDDEFAMPQFSTPAESKPGMASEGSGSLTPRHVHAFCALFEYGDAHHRAELWGALVEKGLVSRIIAQRTTVAVAIAATRLFEDSREVLYKSLFQSGDATLSISEVSVDPVRTMVLRAFIEVDFNRMSKQQRNGLGKDALTLSQSPVGSPVLQKLLEADASGDFAVAVYKSIEKNIPELVGHTSASFLIQALLQASPESVRVELVKKLVELFANLHERLAYPQGSRVMQKLLVYADDATICKIVNELVEKAADDENAGASADDEKDESADEEKEENVPNPLSRKEQREINRKRHYGISSKAIVSYALHSHACYVIQALLRETRTRRLDKERKLLLNELKPHVFDLAISPWAGRIVLDAMLQSGSTSLATAIKDVVFLKAEAWLSSVSEERKKRGGGTDPTIKHILKRQREHIKTGQSDSTPDGSSATPSPKRKSGRIFRSLKH